MPPAPRAPGLPFVVATLLAVLPPACDATAPDGDRVAPPDLEAELGAAPVVLASDPIVLHVVSGRTSGGDGSASRPFADPRAALDAVRARRRSGERRPFAVELDGTFFLDAPLVVGPDVSGGEGASFVLRRAPGRSATLSGALPLRWTGRSGPLLVADLSGVGDPAFHIQHLRAGTLPTFRARYPDFDPARPREKLLTVQRSVGSASPRTEITFPPGTFPPAFQWRGAFVDVYVDDSWENGVFPITSANVASSSVRGAFVLPNQLGPGVGSRFVIENVREALDQPGEWFHDVAGKSLLYYPRPADDLDLGGVALPSYAPALLRIGGGSGAAGQRVHDVVVDGIGFVDTNGSFADPEAALRVSAADRVHVVDCTFRELNGMGVVVDRGATHVDVSHDRFALLGSTAVAAFGSPATPVRNVSIVDNHVERVGRIVKEARGIHLHHAVDTVVAGNLVTTVPRAGIQATGARVLVERNVVRHTGLETADMGALVSGGPDNGGVTWRHNVVHDVVGLNTDAAGTIVTRSSAHGFYGDVYASRHTLVGNVFTGEMSRAVVLHGGTDNVVERNALVERSAMKLWPIPMAMNDGRMRRNTFSRNLMLFHDRATPFIEVPAGYWDPLAITSSHNRFLVADADRAALFAHPRLTPVGAWPAWVAGGFDAGSDWGSFQFAVVRRALPDAPALLLDIAERDVAGASVADLLARLPVGPRR